MLSSLQSYLDNNTSIFKYYIWVPQEYPGASIPITFTIISPIRFMLFAYGDMEDLYCMLNIKMHPQRPASQMSFFTPCIYSLALYFKCQIVLQVKNFNYPKIIFIQDLK